MHCPRCGRQVISADARFCNHCGFALDGVRGLLAPTAPGHDGPPGWLNVTVGADPRSLRGVNQAAYLLALAFVPLLLAAAQGLFGFSLLPALLLMKIFFALLALPALRLGYAAYEARREWRSGGGPHIAAGARGTELAPPANTPPTGIGSGQVKTSELTRPASITEHTTELLDKRRDGV